jgi:hypothetical protein
MLPSFVKTLLELPALRLSLVAQVSVLLFSQYVYKTNAIDLDLNSLGMSSTILYARKREKDGLVDLRSE